MIIVYLSNLYEWLMEIMSNPKKIRDVHVFIGFC